MPCFYPIKEGRNYTRHVNDVMLIHGWCQGNCHFVPAIQGFGRAAMNWTFPSAEQVGEMYDFLWGLEPYAIKWFLPWSGRSLRGEFFEGFLEHPEVWKLILS